MTKVVIARRERSVTVRSAMSNSAARSLVEVRRGIMTDDSAFGDRITTDDEIEAVPDDLLAAATGNGIDPEGSWEYRPADSSTDWRSQSSSWRSGPSVHDLSVAVGRPDRRPVLEGLEVFPRIRERPIVLRSRPAAEMVPPKGG